MAGNSGAGLPLGRYCCAALGLVLAALAEGLLREPAAYLLPGSSPGLLLTRALSAAGLVSAAGLAYRQRLGFRGLSWALGGLSGVLAGAGPAWFFGFSAGGRAAPFELLVPLAIAVLCGLVLGAGARALGPAARSLEVVRYASQPFRAALGLLLLLGGAAMSGRLGLWRTAATLGACSAALAVYLPQLQHYLYGRPPTRHAFVPAALGLCLSFASLSLVSVCVPRQELGRYPGELVFSSRGAGHYVVSSVQQSFEIYRGDVLRLASVDAKRYAESLVHPVLALAPRRKRVLLLGAADGLAEREILAYPDVAQLTTLSDDLSLATLAKDQPFFAALSDHSLRSPRLVLLEAEPLVWLSQQPAVFDVIVVDLPDPSDFSQGKNYTRYFYQQLRAHLSAGGLFVSQATSSAASPRSFSSIVNSIESAGFHTQSYSAAIPTLGEWAFVLGSLSELPTLSEPPTLSALSPGTRAVLARTSYVNLPQLERMLAAPPARDRGAPSNTLAEQPAVELLNNERRARGLLAASSD